jgi:hypothetical protein
MIRLVSHGSKFKYPEEQDLGIVPNRKLSSDQSLFRVAVYDRLHSPAVDDAQLPPESKEREHDAASATDDQHMVDWYGPEDPEVRSSYIGRRFCC